MLKALAIFLFITTLIFAQNQADSLIAFISSKPDTAKIRILNENIWHYRSKAPDLAIQMGNKALEIGEQIGNKKLLATTHNFIGVIYRNKGNYEEALRNYVIALNLSEETKDSIQIAYSLNNIGGIHRLQSNYILALEYILQALKYFEQLGNKTGTAFCTINVGILYRFQHNYSKALEYFNYTLALREEIGDQFGRALTLNQIAEVYYEQRNWDEALKYYNLLKTAYKELEDIKGLASVLGGIGGIYYYKENLDKALEYRERALKISEEIDNPEGQIINLTNLGIIYAKKKRFSEGERLLTKALNLSDLMQSLNMKLEVYNFTKDYYSEKGDYKSALYFSEKYNQLKDSVITNSNIAQIAEMEAVYRTEKNEREKRLLVKDIEIKEKQQIYLIIIVVLILIFGIIIFNRYQASKAANKKLHEVNAMKDKFFSILAHDLKNPLNTLLNYSEYMVNSYDEFSNEERKSGISEIYNSSQNISALVENLLEWARSQTGTIPVSPINVSINSIIEKTVSLFKQNAKIKNIHIATSCDAELFVYCDENILGTILRNLIHNAIKFTHPGGNIEISCSYQNGMIRIAVTDNGIGISEENIGILFRIDREFSTLGTANEKGTGLGLILTKELIDKSGGELFVKSKLGVGSEFIFSIPAAKL